MTPERIAELRALGTQIANNVDYSDNYVYDRRLTAEWLEMLDEIERLQPKPPTQTITIYDTGSRLCSGCLRLMAGQ